MLTNDKLLSCIIAVGNTIQGFVIIKTYLFSLTTDITSNIIEHRGEEREKLKTRKQYIRNLKEYINQIIEKNKINNLIDGFRNSFDKSQNILLE